MPHKEVDEYEDTYWPQTHECEEAHYSECIAKKDRLYRTQIYFRLVIVEPTVDDIPEGKYDRFRKHHSERKKFRHVGAQNFVVDQTNHKILLAHDDICNL